jgi:hypothetical protein
MLPNIFLHYFGTLTPSNNVPSYQIFNTADFTLCSTSLDGFDTLFLPQSEECMCGLSMVESTLIRGIFGPKREEETERWRKLHDM